MKRFTIGFILHIFSIAAMQNNQNDAAVFRPIIEHIQSIVQEKKSTIPEFVAIAGCSAVGKSTFADKLAQMLTDKGISVAILRMDDFLNPDCYIPNHYHSRFEYCLAHAVIQNIKNGQKIMRKPVWLVRTPPYKKGEEDFCVQGVDLILLEGEFAFCDNDDYNFRQYSKFGVFIEATNDNIIRWNWERNRNIIQPTIEEFAENTRPFIEKYRAFVQSSKESATYLINKNADHNATLIKRS